MPLVVSSLTGDASDVFDWILSLNHGNPQDLMTLLQMLREHYCGSLTFREQWNTIENLCQKPNEAAIDFLIRVGTSVSNLAKDWKDELREGELQALQYEVLLNGVKEEITHVLDSEMAKRDGHLMPQEMYEAVKRYETYVVWNKRLDGKGTSTSAGQQKTTGQSSGYKPRFHKTTAFVATTGGLDDEADHPQGSLPPEDRDSQEVEPPHKEDEGGTEFSLHSPPYRPQSNGKIEGFHRFLKACISKHINYGLEWDELTPMATACYNFFPNCSARESAFFAMFGRDPINKLNMLLHAARHYFHDDNGLPNLEALKNIYQVVAQQLHNSRE